MGLDISGLNVLAAFDTSFVTLILSITSFFMGAVMMWMLNTFISEYQDEMTPSYEVEVSQFSDFEEAWFASVKNYRGVGELIACGFFDSRESSVVTVENDDDGDSIFDSAINLNLWSIKTQFMGLMSVSTYQRVSTLSVR